MRVGNTGNTMLNQLMTPPLGKKISIRKEIEDVFQSCLSSHPVQ